jgi:adenylate cyclase
MAARPLFRVPVRRGILVNLLILVLVTAGAIWVAGTWAGHSAVRKLTHELFGQLRANVDLRIVHDLSPAGDLAELNAELIARGLVGVGAADRERSLELLESQVRSGTFNRLFVGVDDGSFLMVRREADGTIAQRIIDVRGGERFWRRIAPDGAETREADTGAYDPRERDWFRDAEAGRVGWTDVYEFASDKVLGVTASRAVAVTDAAGESRRVVIGVDVTLGELQRFLQSLRVTDNGVVFLLDRHNRLVAHSRPDALPPGEPQAVSASTAPAAAAALAALNAGSDREAAGAEPFKATVEISGDGWEVMLAPLADADNLLPPFTVGVGVPRSDILGDIDAFFGTALAIMIGVGAFGLLAALWTARGIAHPIQQLEAEMAEVKEFDLKIDRDIRSYYLEIESMVESFEAMCEGLESFAKYVPAEVVRDLLATGQGARIGGEERELTVFFSDIVGFTPISETTPPRELYESLSEYFDVVVQQMRKHDTTLDKFIGDAVMAFWNAPRLKPDHALCGVLAALDVQAALAEFNAAREAAGKPRFDTRIGLHTADVMVGNVGSAKRLNYTALGDGVNLASRLETANRLYGTQILITQSVVDRLPDGEVVTQPIDLLAVKGRNEGVRIHTVLGRTADVDPARRELAARFADAFETYLARDFATARTQFRELQAADDGQATRRATQLFVERCTEYIDRPPSDGWTGIYKLTQK